MYTKDCIHFLFMSFVELPIENFCQSPFKLIGDDWMLITAGNREKFNTMTASWGGIGILWNKPVAFCFIRPQRYTLEFMNKEDYFTLSFFDDNMRSDLLFCGKNSGRDVDKMSRTKLKPIFSTNAPYFEQAKLVFVCKKSYVQTMKQECFLDKSLDSNFYPDKDYHECFIAEIVKVLKRDV